MSKSNCQTCEALRFSLFQTCKKKNLDRFLKNNQCSSLNQGDELIQQGNPCEGVYCINNGVLKVNSNSSTGNPTTVRYADKGEIIGLDAFINNKNHHHSVEAFTDAHVCFIPKADFQDFLENEPDFQLQIIQTLCKRVNHTEERMVELVLKNTGQRLASHLIDLLELRDGNITEPIQYSQDELSNYIGTTNYYLYKILISFSKKGLIRTAKNKLWVLDPKKLEKVAEGELGLSSGSGH